MHKKIILIFFVVGLLLLNSCSKEIGIKINEDPVNEDQGYNILKRGNGQRCIDHEDCRSGYCGATRYGDSVCMPDPTR